MKILIIDDEYLALERMSRILSELGFDDVTASSDFNVALQNKFDVVFLDINMPEITGIDLAKKILETYPLSKIIFQTAYSDFAVDAFDIGSVDYILKPIESQRVDQAMQRVKKLISKNNDKLVLKLGNNSYIVNPSDICYVKADLAEVYAKSKSANGYMARTIGELEIVLEKYGFVRVHRSYLVNINKVKSLSTIENSKFVVTFFDIDDELVSSKDGAKYLRNHLDNISL